MAKHEEPEPEEVAVPLLESREATTLEGEAVLMALTALFGFQLSVAFTETFEKLEQLEKGLHLTALGLTALAICISLIPAAYGRQAEPRKASQRFVKLGSAAFSIAMAPMLVSLSLNFGLIARIVLGEGPMPHVMSGVLALLFVVSWYVFPQIRARQLAAQQMGPVMPGAASSQQEE